MIKRLMISLLLAGAVMACSAMEAKAIFIEGGDSTEGIGAYYGQIYYYAHSESEGMLYVTLTNVSDPANGGYITGFVLNNPNNWIARVTPVVDFPEAFEVVGGEAPYEAAPASPFGIFDFGAALGGKFLGGGSPEMGIPADYYNSTMTFAFLLEGADGVDMTQLQDWHFMSVYSTPKNKKSTQSSFAVRFKGFEDDSSDKVVGVYSWGGIE